MARILLIRFGAFPGPHRAAAEVEHVLKALGPRHAVDALVPRAGDQPFFERLHRARVLRVPLGAGTLEERAQAFRRAVRRQFEGGEYDLVVLGSAAFAGEVLAQLGPGMKLAVAPDPAEEELELEVGAPSSPVVGSPAQGTAGGPSSWPLHSPAQWPARWIDRADVTWVRSEAARQELLAIAGRERAIEVCAPGVDVDRFDWEEAPPGPPRVVYILHQGQARRGLGRVAAAVARLEPEVRLAIAGAISDEERARIEGPAAARIDWLGPIEAEDMPALYATASCVALPLPPDEREGPPMALLEAMACRRVVVAPRTPLTVELLAGGEAGLLYDLPAQDNEERAVAELARALADALDDEPRRERLGAAAHARVRARWTAAAHRRRLREIVSGLGVTTSVIAPLPAPPLGLHAEPGHSDTDS